MFEDDRDLPDGWRREPLANCVDVLDSRRKPVNSTERAMRVGAIPYYGATGQVGWIDDYLFNEEIVLLGEDGAPFYDKSKPIAYIVDGKSWVNNHAHVLRARPEVTSNHFIKYYLDSFDFNGYVQGSTRDKLTQGAMNSIPVLLPPRELQNELVNVLDAVERKRESAGSHLAAALRAVERFSQAVIAAACSGRLTEDCRDAHPHRQTLSGVLRAAQRPLSPKRSRAIAAFDACDLPGLPSTWAWVPLAAVSDSTLGKMLDKGKNKGEPRPYLRNTNVRWRGFDLDDVSEMRFEAGEEERYGLERGDVLVCEGGEPGRAAVWRDGDSDMRFQKALHRVRCEGTLLPDFLVNVLQAHAFSGMLAGYFTGSGIAHLTGVSLARVPLPLPPIEEQQEIVRRVDQLFAMANSLKQRIELASTRIERSSQAVLAKVFRGDLVTNDS